MLQACPPCSSTTAATQLEDAISQLTLLTELLAGEERDQVLSYRSSLEKEEPIPSSPSSRSSMEKDEEERSNLSCSSLCSQDREWRYARTYDGLSSEQDDSDSCYLSYPGPSPTEPPPTGRRLGSTSILLERGAEGTIRSIVRLDSQEPPAILYSRELEVEFVPESAVTYHNYISTERKEGSCQTEVVRREEEATQTEARERREEASQTEEDKTARRRRESRELAMSMAQEELGDLATKLEEAQTRSNEQVSEILLLSRRVDQLHRRSSEPKLEVPAGQKGSFIIKDLQSQVGFGNCSKYKYSPP